MRAKKKYGQHFLVDDSVTHKIADQIVEASKTIPAVLEVGPGRGALTRLIFKELDSFKAIEIDVDTIKILTSEFPSLASKIIQGDFLKLDLNDLFGKSPFVLVGNFPYNISSQIIFKMIDHFEKIPIMIGMFQKEVADRIIAPEGSKTYGILSVLSQFYYEGTKLFDIEPDAFDPPPKVMSSVILLRAHTRYKHFDNYKLFKTIVKQSFGQRRKMLRNTLKSFISDNELSNHSIFEKRPEQLSVDAFIEITEMIEKTRL